MQLTDKYDHPSGIPTNWDGTRYGIPFGPVKFIVGLFLIPYGVIATGCGVFALLTIKFLPSVAYVFYQYLT